MPSPFYVPRMSRRIICHGEYHALDTLFSFPRRSMPGKGQVPLLTSMGLIEVKVAGPGTAESGLGKERSGEPLSREAGKARGTASYDDAVKTASKNSPDCFQRR